MGVQAAAAEDKSLSQWVIQVLERDACLSPNRYFTAFNRQSESTGVGDKQSTPSTCASTIAHGFLSLSLIPALSAGLAIRPEGLKMAVNYGLDSVRFIQPVRVGSRVRMQLTVIDVTEKNPGQWLVKSRATLEIEGVKKPAYIAETLALYFV